ncbi:MAG: site-specific DNA-methyltransferase [Methanomassiliicoccales archaeon]
MIWGMYMKPYFSIPGFELYLQDCLVALDELEPESVDMIFADPPYNLSNGGFTCHSGKRAPVNKGEWDISRGIENDFEFHKQWISKCKRLLKENATIWISGTYHSIYACGFALQLCGYQILNDICWFKPNAAPNISTRYFTASHETLIWAKKSADSKHYFNYELMKNGVWKKDPLKKPGKQMRSVWSIPTPSPSEKKLGKHPTQKPIELLMRIILSSTKEGDTILDPFTGSSTTGLVAYATNRKFIGIDNNKEYLDLSIKRLNALQDDMSKVKKFITCKLGNFE